MVPLAQRGLPHRRSTFAGLPWEDVPEASARNNLSKGLTHLRQMVDHHNRPRLDTSCRVLVCRYVFSACGALIRGHYSCASPGPTVKAFTPIGGIVGLNVKPL